MQSILNFIATIFIFAIAPIATAWVVKVINPYFSRRFPVSTKDKQKIAYLLSDENPNRAKYERYALIEVMIFIVPVGFFMALLPFLLPLSGLRAQDTLNLSDIWICIGIVLLPGMALAIALAAYISNFIIRAIYKIFNPKDNTGILYYTSRIMNASAAGIEVTYDPKAGNRGMLLAFLLIYPVALYIGRANVDILTESNFHSGGTLISKDYKMEDLNLKLYADDEKTRLEIRLRNEDIILHDVEILGGWIDSVQEFMQSR